MSMASCSKEVMLKHVKEIVACDHVMVSVAFDCGDGTNFDSLVKDLILKSHFLDIDEKELENINKGGRKVNKHVKLRTKNAFDEWKVFCGFDTSKSMLSFLTLQVGKNDNNLYPLMSLINFHYYFFYQLFFGFKKNPMPYTLFSPIFNFKIFLIIFYSFVPCSFFFGKC
jgi:hypothetical protein